MADTFVDVAVYGHSYASGDILYAFLYPAMGEHVKFESINPEKLDQSIRSLYDYPSGARRIHHFRMKLEVYFGAQPLSFFRIDSSKIEFRKDNVHRIVDVYRRGKSLPRQEISREELEEMVCHEGNWYANEYELQRALDRKREQTAYEPWAVPDWMLKPKPQKRPVRRRKRRIN